MMQKMVRDKPKYSESQLPRVMNGFIEYLQSLDRSENTINNYIVDVSAFLKYVKKEKQDLVMDLDKITLKGIDKRFLQSINSTDCEKFAIYLKKQDLSASTRSRRLSGSKTFFKYCKKMNITKDNPMMEVEKPKIPERKPVYMELSEVKQLLGTIKASDSIHNIRDLAIITTFISTGIRLSELVDLNLEHIHDRTSVIGKGNKERTIAFIDLCNDVCIGAIEEYLKVRPDAPGEDALFLSNRNKRMHPRTIQDMLKKYMDEAGLSEKYTVHKLRHTAATMMYQHNNIDILELKEILGHTDINTTKIYTNTSNDKIRKAMNNSPLNDLM